MVVLNNLDRYQLALDAISRVPRLADQVGAATDRYFATMERHKLWVSEHGEDMPEVRGWRWTPRVLRTAHVGQAALPQPVFSLCSKTPSPKGRDLRKRGMSS